MISRPLGYERVYLPLHKVADTPFYIIQGDVVFDWVGSHPASWICYDMLMLPWSDPAHWQVLSHGSISDSHQHAIPLCLNLKPYVP